MVSSLHWDASAFGLLFQSPTSFSQKSIINMGKMQLRIFCELCELDNLLHPTPVPSPQLLPSLQEPLNLRSLDKFGPIHSRPISYLAGTWGDQEGLPGLDPRGALGSECQTAPC